MNYGKSKKTGIRRLPQWDSQVIKEKGDLDEEEALPLNRMCSCRISCRSVRCSCVKMVQSCNSICLCVSCDNPLNILESIGLNVEFSLKDTCLFQNVYQIPKLTSFLSKEIKLSCCNSFARVRDCIPGTVLCPNEDCNASLEFSWCRGLLCHPDRNPRNHCSYCGECCFNNRKHCYTCKKCYVFSSKSSVCPICKGKPATPRNIITKPKPLSDIKSKNEDQNPSKPISSTDIILLDVYSIPKLDISRDVKDSPNSKIDSKNEASSSNEDDQFKLKDSFKDGDDLVVTMEVEIEEDKSSLKSGISNDVNDFSSCVVDLKSGAPSLNEEDIVKVIIQ